MLVTTTSLFDALARDARSGTARRDPAQLSTLAEKMIGVSLSDLDHLRGYEQDLRLGEINDSALESELRRTIWQLYKEWAIGAQDLYQRAKSLRRDGQAIAGVDRLNDEIGKIEARLTVTPEKTLKARQQAREGHIIPAKELRDELNARLRG